jgi:hypothetical protein
MSWKENTLTEFIITTGDGESYKPFWKNPSRAVEFNISQFNFPNLNGTKVERGTPMGRTFTLELYFVGFHENKADHLVMAERFSESANDKRPWKIQHPYYGLLNVQPVSITFDNSEDNVTKLTIPVIETILDDNPKKSIDAADTIILGVSQLNETNELTITEPIATNEINTLSSNASKSYNLSIPIVPLGDFEEYYNAFNQASNLINTATATPILAMRSVIGLLSYPAKFNISAKDRINILLDTFNTLRKTITVSLSVASKQLYQLQQTAILSGICLASVTPLSDDFLNRKTVLKIISSIIESYSNLINDLDTLQSTNGSTPLSFIPNANSMVELESLIYYTLSNLYKIALNSRSERFIITERDTNIILLTHRLYGLDKEDKNINELIENNNWGLNHLLLIPKNTTVTYFI